MHLEKLFFRSGLAAGILCLCGCVAVPVESVPALSDSRSVTIDKGYAIGAVAKAHVGQSILRAQPYESRSVELLSMRADRPFRAEGSNINMLGAHFVFEPRGDSLTFPILAKAVHEGKTLSAVAVPFRKAGVGQWMVSVDQCAPCVLVANTGQLTDRVLWSGTVQPGKLDISRSGVVFSEVTETSEIRVRPLQGPHELIYSGMSGGQIKLSYREYTTANLAREAFFQELSYDADAAFIRFKNYRIKVISASSETLEFAVVEDGE